MVYSVYFGPLNKKGTFPDWLKQIVLVPPEIIVWDGDGNVEYIKRDRQISKHSNPKILFDLPNLLD